MGPIMLPYQRLSLHVSFRQMEMYHIILEIYDIILCPFSPQYMVTAIKCKTHFKNKMEKMLTNLQVPPLKAL